jgi:hypothetical protein
MSSFFLVQYLTIVNISNQSHRGACFLPPQPEGLTYVSPGNRPGDLNRDGNQTHKNGTTECVRIFV